MKSLRGRVGIRARVLAMALIPSVALLTAGVGVSGYLVRQGVHAQDWADQMGRGAPAGIRLAADLQQERMIAIGKIAGRQPNPAELASRRRAVDADVRAQFEALNVLYPMNPTAMRALADAFGPLAAQLPAVRQRADAATLSADDAYTFYGQFIGLIEMELYSMTQSAPDTATALAEAGSVGLFCAGEAISRAAALLPLAAAKPGLSDTQLAEFNYLTGRFRNQFGTMSAGLPAQFQSRLRTLQATPEYREIAAAERAVILAAARPSDSDSTATKTASSRASWAGSSASGPSDAAAAPISMPTATGWQNAAAEMHRLLGAVYDDQRAYNLDAARHQGDRSANRALTAGAAVAVFGLAAFLLALVLSGRLIRRLQRLRKETLELADVRLPAVMARLRAGEDVDPTDTAGTVATLDYGSDEIGEVADAFNRAQNAAVTAAVTEAKTRDGVQAVFLSIAHRSQIVVHRQLEILEEIEHEIEHPRHLNMLFKLDHLATRERRNAENLIILGGERPGRRWSTPVPLIAVVRGAVGETEEFARVRVVQVPELMIQGGAVTDLVHLLAELVDNATSYSPPESRVQVTGGIVGKGVAVEIEDQGLGMTAEELARANETLANPPDFSVATLSSDSRVGLFVVARLAKANGVAIRLVESDYGGVRAIVIIPTALISTAPAPEATASVPNATESASAAAGRAATSVAAVA
ncbi:MAG: HAMP domain-containing protein, partial [Mycobacteriaceae bacterium]|nr:HAMP domain-containing protein [Mycobacteriaceae bacterium]